MTIPDLRSVVVALGALSAGTAGWAITDSPTPLAATACVGVLEIGIRRLLIRRRQRRALAAAPAPAADTENAAGQEDLLAALGRDVARAERYGDPLTLCLVKLQERDRLPEATRAAADQHLSAAVDRVTRASDSWYTAGKGTLAVILERCTSNEASFFAERLQLAVNSRPLIAEGKQVPAEITISQTQYDPHQFVGAADFLAAARTARLLAPGRRERLVADGRFLREQVYGKDRTAGAA